MFDINEQPLLKDLEAGQQFTGVLYCSRAELQTTKMNTKYWNCTLSDNSWPCGIQGRLFDASGDEDISTGAIVYVSGNTEIYNQQLQLRINRVVSCNNTTRPEVIERVIPTCQINVDRAWNYINNTVNSWKNKDLKRLFEAVINKVGEDNYKDCAAGARVHHSGRHGLLLHVSSMLVDVEGICKAYPAANKEIVQCGIILHDVGKIAGEMEFTKFGTVSDYSIDGTLSSHLYIGSRLVENIGEELNIEKELLRQIVHIIQSHHGKLEYQAIVLPKTIEAIIVSAIDMLDAQVNQVIEATIPVEPGALSEKIATLDGRKIYKPKGEL